MPTPTERRALAAALLVAALGAAARVRSSLRDPPGAAEARALEAHLKRVDSARKGEGRKAKAASRPKLKRDSSVTKRNAVSRSDGGPEPLLDLDRATATEIERLPRVGPALAARIVAARDSCDGLGSLEALDQVKGIGPSLIRQLSSRVTFSGRAGRRCPGNHNPLRR